MVREIGGSYSERVVSTRGETSSGARVGYRFPLVSVIIPTRNEEKFIGACLDSVLASDYPSDRLEILVVDGVSEDSTRDVVAEYSRRHSSVRLLDNPKKITAAAFNIGIGAAGGERIMITGAHSLCAPQNVRLCAEHMERFGADNVGGVLLTVPQKPTRLGKAIAAVLSHPFGVGNAAFRTGVTAPTWVDTVFGGFYRRDVFARVGLWNEELTYSQDLEFNRRLARTGGRTLLVPDVVSFYSARSDLISFTLHTFRNGLWAILPFAYASGMPVSLRQLVPGLFVGSLAGLLLIGFAARPFWAVATAVALGYAAAAMTAALDVALRKRAGGLLLILPATFALLHFTYGIGSLLGGVWVVAGAVRRAWLRFSDRLRERRE